MRSKFFPLLLAFCGEAQDSARAVPKPRNVVKAVISPETSRPTDVAPESEDAVSSDGSSSEELLESNSELSAPESQVEKVDYEKMLASLESDISAIDRMKDDILSEKEATPTTMSAEEPSGLESIDLLAGANSEAIDPELADAYKLGELEV